MRQKLAVFVSGNGTNLQQITEYFRRKGHEDVAEVALVVSNNASAFALQRAKNLGIESKVITKEELASTAFIEELRARNISWIILAGFLWLIPSSLITAFPNKIVNIHPALLPNYGGKGFYGHHVHEAVVAAKESFSGITIHFVNEKYDSGDIIFQAKVALEDTDTADDVAAKIHVLEEKYYPSTIENLLKK